MAEPVLGKDAVILFEKGGDYFPYACAISIGIEFIMETKSVKTIGDGVHKRKRGQSLDHRITLDGLIKFDDDTVPHSFDLLAYHQNMTDIPYRIVFTNDQSQLKVIEGIALPTNVSLGGGSEGFANGSITLEGNGPYEILDAPSGCSATITGGEMIVVGSNNGFRITALTGGPVTRYDWAVNDSSRSSAFVDGTLPDEFSLGFLWPTGTDYNNLLTVWPICENGNDGIPFEIEFQSGEPN